MSALISRSRGSGFVRQPQDSIRVSEESRGLEELGDQGYSGSKAMNSGKKTRSGLELNWCNSISRNVCGASMGCRDSRWDFPPSTSVKSKCLERLALYGMNAMKRWPEDENRSPISTLQDSAQFNKRPAQVPFCLEPLHAEQFVRLSLSLEHHIGEAIPRSIFNISKCCLPTVVGAVRRGISSASFGHQLTTRPISYVSALNHCEQKKAGYLGVEAFRTEEKAGMTWPVPLHRYHFRVPGPVEFLL